MRRLPRRASATGRGQLKTKSRALRSISSNRPLWTTIKLFLFMAMSSCNGNGLKSRLSIGAAVLFSLLIPRSALAEDYTVHAFGSFFYLDPADGKPKPLAFAWVELWDSDCDGSTICDDLMGFSFTNEKGEYDILGLGGDPFSGKP